MDEKKNNTHRRHEDGIQLHTVWFCMLNWNCPNADNNKIYSKNFRSQNSVEYISKAKNHLRNYFYFCCLKKWQTPFLRGRFAFIWIRRKQIFSQIHLADKKKMLTDFLDNVLAPCWCFSWTVNEFDGK